MSQIRLSKTKEIEQIINKVRPFFALNTEAEILKTLAGIGFEVFEKKLILNLEENNSEKKWTTSGIKQISNWSKEADEGDFEWNLDKQERAPELIKAK
jgi:broad-specificity NMP kinase